MDPSDPEPAGAPALADTPHARLAAAEDLMRLFADEIPGLLGYWDRDQRCRFANRHYPEWFGRRADDVIGLSLRDLLGEPTYELSVPYIAGVLAGQHQQFERPLTMTSGEVRHTWTQYIPHLDDAGQVAGFFALALDITERKRAELSLRDLNAALAESRRQAEAANAAKSEFLATISHEIRTPLNAILGILHLLQQTELNARQADYIAKSHGAAAALLGLLDTVLDLSKVEAGKLTIEHEPFGLDELLHGVSSIVTANVRGSDVEILFDIDPSVPATLTGDALRLRQVLVNLAGNAAKFTDSGEIVIAVRRETGMEGEARLAFAVSDTGIGIAFDRLPAIFEGFAQGEASITRRFGGSGLGLAISQRLVGLMGGQIRVESAPGLGSTFAFSIPMALPAGDAGAPLSPGVGAPRALVVDDNASARRVLRALGESLGWRVDDVPGAEAALALLRAADAATPPYDVILIDFIMPGQDGFETGLAISALPASAATPLVMMVSINARETLARRQGAHPALVDALLIKPVTRSMLIEAVDSARMRRNLTVIAQRSGAAPAPPAPEDRATAIAPDPASTPGPDPRRDPGHDPAGAAAMRRGVGAGEKRARSAAEQPVSRAEGRLAGLSLLLVDDETINREVAEALLVLAGARVRAVASCQEAMLVLADDRRFDAILMDVQMDGTDGYTATRRIRARFGLHDIPIIALTANALDADHEAARAAGMADYIVKPYTPAGMAEVIERQARRLARPLEPAPPAPSVAVAGRGDASGAETGETQAAGAGRPETVLDPSTALAALDGNTKLYRRILRAAQSRAPEMLDEAAVSLAAGKPAEARRLLHTLKTLAGMAGAVTVGRLASDVEHAAEVTIASRLPALIAATASMAAAIEPLLAGADEETAPPASGVADWREGLLTLAERLTDGDMQAVVCLEALQRAHPDRCSPGLAQVREAIARFDFPLAARICYKLVADINPGGSEG